MEAAWSTESLAGGDPCRQVTLRTLVFAKERNKPWLNEDLGPWELFKMSARVNYSDIIPWWENQYHSFIK